MSDSQTVTIPAGGHAATQKPGPRGSSENWPGARNHSLPSPWPASSAEPGRRRETPASDDRALHRHEQAGHVERAGHTTKGRGRPAIIWRITPAGHDWLNEHDQAPALAAAAAAQAQCKTEQAQRTATERDRALDQARATFNRQTPRISRKRAAHQLRELGSPSTRSAPSSTSARKESARTSCGTRRRGRRQAHPENAEARANPAAEGHESPTNAASTPERCRAGPMSTPSSGHHRASRRLDLRADPQAVTMASAPTCRGRRY